jgi:Xaa-Pro aminopeptidase
MLDSRNLLQTYKTEGFLVTKPSNIFYLCGFRGSNGYVLLTERHSYLFTDPRYLERAAQVVPEGWKVVDISEGFLNLLHTALVKHRIKRLGIEAAHVTALSYKRLEALNGIKLVDTVDAIEAARMVKSAEELRSIRQSQKINEQVLKLALEGLKPGLTEAQLAWRIKLLTHDMGASDVSFPPIVAFGGHTSRPHHEPSAAKKLKRGDMILIDMGIVYKNYASDLTRTFFTKTPTSEQGDVYTTVLTAHQAAVTAIKPGALADDIDRTARLFISDSGYKKKFGHATGHGIGLDVHELPRVAKGDQTELAAGMVITVEPGIYLPGKLGVRIEDMIEVTAGGHKVLNSFPKEMAAMVLKV